MDKIRLSTKQNLKKEIETENEEFETGSNYEQNFKITNTPRKNRIH